MNRQRRRLSNSQGMTLMMMVALMAITSIMILTLTTLNHLVLKASKTADLHQEIGDFQNALAAIANDITMCNYFFAGAPLNPVAPVQAAGPIPPGSTASPEFPAVAGQLQVGTQISPDLTITSIAWQNPTNLLTPAQYVLSGNTYQPVSVTLNIQLTTFAVTGVDSNGKVGAKTAFGASAFNVSVPNIYVVAWDGGPGPSWVVKQCESPSASSNAGFFNQGWQGSLTSGSCYTQVGSNITCNPGYYLVSETFNDANDGIPSLTVTGYSCCTVPSQ